MKHGNIMVNTLGSGSKLPKVPDLNPCQGSANGFFFIVRKLFQSTRFYIKGILKRLASKCAWQIVAKLEA